MNLLIYLVVAAVIGWVATELMHDRSNLLINIVVAVVGAFLAGYFLSPIFHVGTINDAITIPTMLVTLLGSIILLAVVNLFRGRGRAHSLIVSRTIFCVQAGCVRQPHKDF
jgi:uncharacterized membrane protein YeaQ/YmgE (transglycosylase-associated protein family)